MVKLLIDNPSVPTLRRFCKATASTCVRAPGRKAGTVLRFDPADQRQKKKGEFTKKAVTQVFSGGGWYTSLQQQLSRRAGPTQLDAKQPAGFSTRILGLLIRRPRSTTSLLSRWLRRRQCLTCARQAPRSRRAAAASCSRCTSLRSVVQEEHDNVSVHASA